MNDRDTYNRYLDDFGAQLGRAATHRPKRRRTVLATSTVVATIASVAIVVTALSPSTGPVGVLERASAALADRGHVLHYVVRPSTVAPTGSINRPTVPAQCESRDPIRVWQTTTPDRWRVALPAQPTGGRCDTIVDGRRMRVIRGPQEMSWNAGTTTRWVPALRALDIVRGYPAKSSVGDIPLGDPSLGTGDPVHVLRRMLADGQLTDRGEETLNGRAVRVLTGRRENRNTSFKLVTTVTYAVDATSAEPVRAITNRQITPTPGSNAPAPPNTAAQQLDFTTFQRLPATPANTRLLDITTTGKTDRTDLTLDELRRELRSRKNDRRPIRGIR